MITTKEASEAAARFAIMPFFPAEAIARTELAATLVRMVSTPQQLEWLVQAVTGHVDRWPGLREVRAIFCTRYKPADGIEEWSAIPGFTAGDSEADHLAKIEAPKRAEVGHKSDLNRISPADEKKK